MIVPLFVVLLSMTAVTSADGFRITDELAQLIAHEEFEEAEVAALRQDPPNPLLIGWLKMRTGKVEEGLELIRREKSVDLQSDTAVEEILEISSVVASASRPDGISLLETWLENPSLAGEERLWLQLLQFHAASSQPGNGEPVARQVLSLDPDPEALLTPLYMFAVSLYEQEQPALAMIWYEELRKRVPKTRLDPGYQLQYAHLLTASGDPLRSLEIIDGIRTDFEGYASDNAGLLVMASGLAFEALGDPVRAEQEFAWIVKNAEGSGEIESFADAAEGKINEYRDDARFRTLTDTSVDLSPIDRLETQSTGSGLLLAANLVVLLLMCAACIARAVAKAGNKG